MGIMSVEEFAEMSSVQNSTFTRVPLKKFCDS